ncbi:MAG: tRNA (adenosine(37)-N6)-dimethylallyltransferase MiaA [Planctomycetes bacterium]|nr:tRNA (adenosine(37)-N6)-dimethylallyltransferase MiaA [Planctomycetota bacterium]
MEFFLVGQTATGKHELAVEIAEKLNCEIISIDSMKVYKDLDIGTCKPSSEERSRIAHHLIDVTTPDDQFNVGRFIETALAVSKQIASSGKNILYTGGTFLYYKALVYGFNQGFQSDESIRKRLEHEYEADPAKVFSGLKQIDIKTAEKLHLNDKKRIVRALEFFELTGKPSSDYKTHFQRDVSEVNVVALVKDLVKLEQNIRDRIVRMVREGLVEEAKSANNNYKLSKEVKGSIGYKESLELLDGKLTTDELVEAVFIRTRRFARKQMTWVRSLKELKIIDLTDKSKSDIINLVYTLWT